MFHPSILDRINFSLSNILPVSHNKMEYTGSIEQPEIVTRTQKYYQYLCLNDTPKANTCYLQTFGCLKK